MIHIILDRENNKGLINIQGNKNEVRSDIACLYEKLYTDAPDVFLEFLDVLNVYANYLKEKELKKNDQNNSSNKSREQDH